VNTPHQSTETFDEVAQAIWNYLSARDQHHDSPRGLAISIALEASELLEHYQWREESDNSEAIAEELADIFIYAFTFALGQDIDIAAAIHRKLKKAALKYPAKDFKGKTANEREAARLNAKLHYRKEGL